MGFYEGTILCDPEQTGEIVAFLNGCGFLDVTCTPGSIQAVTGLLTVDDLNRDLKRIRATFPEAKVSMFVVWKGMTAH